MAPEVKLREGNFWDESVHDYAELTWRTTAVLISKVARLLQVKVEESSTFILLLPTVIQLPVSCLAAANTGLIPVLVNAADPALSVTRLATIIEATKSRLVLTVDGLWQGHKLIETKKMLDDAISLAEQRVIRFFSFYILKMERELFIIGGRVNVLVNSKNILKLGYKTNSTYDVVVIRHCGPQSNMPAPQKILPGRRPCYSLKVPMTEERDNEWGEMFAKIPIEPETEINKSAQSNMNTLLQIPYWYKEELYLKSHTIESVKERIDAITQLMPPSPSVTMVYTTEWNETFFAACFASFQKGSTLLLVGLLSFYTAKVDTLILCSEQVPLDREYLTLLPVPSLSRVIAHAVTLPILQSCFPGVKQFLELSLVTI